MIRKMISTALALSLVFGNAAMQPANINVFDTAIAVSASDKAPGQVKNVKSNSLSSTAAQLSWDKVNNAKGYRIYVYNTGTKKYSKVITIPRNTTTGYKLTGLKSGKEYKYKVRAYQKANGQTLWGKSSKAVTVSPAKDIMFRSNAVVYNVPGEGNPEYDSYASLDSIVVIKSIDEHNDLIKYIKQKYPKGIGATDRSKVIKQLKEYDAAFFGKNALIYSMAVTEGANASFVLAKTEKVTLKQKNNKLTAAVKTSSREIIPDGRITDDEWYTRFNCYFTEVDKAAVKNVKGFGSVDSVKG
ncbi:MAG: fibronectin type III domain-containing protein [Ruminococcus sp.]|nr:fibronectin type III domain-containing protein [Ruminococcus sp.]